MTSQVNYLTDENMVAASNFLTPKALIFFRKVTEQSFVHESEELTDVTYLVSYSGTVIEVKRDNFEQKIKDVNVTQEYLIKFNVYMNG